MPYISERMLPDWPAWDQILYCMSGCRAQLAPVQCTSNSKTSGRRQNGTSQCSATSQAGTNGLFGCWFNAVFPEPPKNPTAFGNQQYTTVQPLTAFNTWETFSLYSNFIEKPCSVGNNCWQTDKENTFSSKSKKGKKKIFEIILSSFWSPVIPARHWCSSDTPGSSQTSRGDSLLIPVTTLFTAQTARDESLCRERFQSMHKSHLGISQELLHL